MQVQWNIFKNALQNGNLTLKEINLGDNYWLKAFDGEYSLECLIPSDEQNSDTQDYLTNFQSQANKPLKTKVLTEPANISLTHYIATDVITISAGDEENIDIQLQQIDNEIEHILYGGALYTQDAEFEDYVKFQVIDIDNVLGYGANLILKEYITKAYLDDNGKFEDYDEAGAYLPVGVYLRCIYKSTKASGTTKVKINYLLGIPS